jgi:hypothetical protein
VTFRLRKVAKMATESGSPPAGLDRESKFCNEDVACEESVDCKFTDWDAWSDCSMTCAGVKRRERRIGQYGKGNGEYCLGALKETWPCNPEVNQPMPKGCGVGKPVDCELAGWSAWTACSASCGGGQHYRERDVLVPPQNGGKACEAGGDGSLKQVKQCQAKPCPGPKPVDCAFGDWEDWAACAKCGGQRKRFRRITRFPLHGGKNCDKFSSEEVGKCDMLCEKHGYCIWEDWSKYGACSVKCGTGKQMRTRKLKFSMKAKKGDAPKLMMKKYQELSLHAEALEQRDHKEVLMAFGLGFFCLAGAIAGFRFFAQMRSRSGQMTRVPTSEDPIE